MSELKYQKNDGIFYQRLSSIPIVHELIRHTFDRYEKTKRQYPMLNSFESEVVKITERARPVYDQYLQDKVATANKVACDTLAYLEKTYPQINTTPEELCRSSLRYYDESLLRKAVDYAFSTKDQAMVVVSNTKQVAVHTVDVGVGAAVISTQLGVAISLAIASLGIDILIVSKNAGLKALEAVNRSETYIQTKMIDTFTSSKKKTVRIGRLTGRVLKVPGAVFVDNTNALLDVVDTLVDQYIVDGPISDDDRPESVASRLSHLGNKMIVGMTIRSVRRSIQRTVEELRGSLIILVYVKQSRNWVTKQVVYGYDRVSTLLKTIETQAREYKVKPEVLLLHTIRISSSALTSASDQLLRNTDLLLSEPFRSQIRLAVDYVHSIEQSFSKANNLYDIRDEVVSEARDKLTVVEQSLIGAVDHLADCRPISWMTTKMKRSISTASEPNLVANGNTSRRLSN